MALDDIIQDIDELTAIPCHTCEQLEECRKLLPDAYNFKIITFNVRSYQHNFDDFYTSLQRVGFDPDVIVLTECWLDDSTIIEILPGYIPFRSNTQANKNGGVIMYIKSTWKTHMLETELTEADNILTILDDKIAILGIYRSPSFHSLDNFTISLDSELTKLQKHPTIIVTGDVNIDIHNTTNTKHTEYLCIMTSHALLPAIIHPTRGNTCIDHIFIKSSNKLLGVIGKSSITDHDIVMAGISQKNVHPTTSRTRWKTKIDEEAVATEINSIDWSDVLKDNCPNNSTNLLIEILSESISKNTHKVAVSRSKHTIKPWITPGLLRCMRHRDKLHLSARSHPHDEMRHLIYNRYKNFCNNLLRKVRTEYNSHLIYKNRDNPKKLWNTVKSIYNPTEKTDPVDFLNTCNSYFTSLGKNLSDLILTRLSETQSSLANKYKPQNTPVKSFFFHPTDEVETEKNINDLKIDSAPGLDNIGVNLIIQIKKSLLAPLTHIFNLSLESGIFPDRWKIACIRPIYKSGAKDLSENYRPIALLCILSKLLEKVVNKRIMNFMEDNRLISDRQFGFRRGKSTEDAALLLTNSIASFIENGEHVMTVFLDLAKAFDTISVDLLLAKLEGIGVRGNALNWFKTYLSGRQQLVKVGEFSSGLLPINFGIPQGSILGPTLFAFYMNDILNAPLKKAEIISYADDTAIIFHSETWEHVFQRAESGLLRISEVLNSNLLTLNVKKTNFITFFKTSSTSPPSHLALKFHTCNTHRSPVTNCSCPNIEKVSSLKYLGITIDENLSFKPHIHLIANRVRKFIYIAKKLRDCTPINILRTVYLGLCQSILQYGIAVWGGAGKNTFIEIERAQRAVLKVILKKPFRFPTDQLYSEFPVLRVRQLFILSATLHVHRNFKRRSDYQHLLSKRVLNIPLPNSNSQLARRCSSYLHTHIYNKINKHCNIKLLNLHPCKRTMKKWLLSLSYAETEDLLS